MWKIKTEQRYDVTTLTLQSVNIRISTYKLHRALMRSTLHVKGSAGTE
jgi:hypothetical protein